MNQSLPSSESVEALYPVGEPLPMTHGIRRIANTPKRQKQPANDSAPKTTDDWKEIVQERRRRQESVAKILNRTFGQFAQSHPDLWGRRAFLMLVGVMYQWLEANEQEVSTEELVTLSKMLAEQRRAEAQSHESAEPRTGPEAVGAEGELPENLGDAVKQVYGTNFQAVETLKAETRKAETM